MTKKMLIVDDKAKEIRVMLCSLWNGNVEEECYITEIAGYTYAPFIKGTHSTSHCGDVWVINGVTEYIGDRLWYVPVSILDEAREKAFSLGYKLRFFDSYWDEENNIEDFGCNEFFEGIL